MSAHTSATLVKENTLGAGGEGLKLVTGTFTGSASYDSGGSVLDLSGLFGGKVYHLAVNAAANDLVCNWVPGTSYASTDGLVRMDDVSGGAEATGSQAGITFNFVAIGADA
jgi:hypothetical protein